MAEFTKPQIKKMVRPILETLDEIKLELEAIKDDVESESYSIEPYEGRNNLTPAQEERQEWLDNVASVLGDLIDNLDTSELGGYVEE